MPALSRWVISTGVWLSSHAWLVLAAVLAIAVALRMVFKLPGFTAGLIERAARLPVLGE